MNAQIEQDGRRANRNATETVESLDRASEDCEQVGKGHMIRDVRNIQQPSHLISLSRRSFCLSVQ